jgi:hypothetical protein
MTKRKTLFAVICCIFSCILLIGIFAQQQPTRAQGDNTPNPVVATAVAMTLTAFTENMSTPTLTTDQEIAATVNASLRKTVWIEDMAGNKHAFMSNLAIEIRAEDRNSADLLVQIREILTRESDLSITGCGNVPRYKVDYDITLTDRKTNGKEQLLLRGYTPNPFIVNNCNDLYGRPSFDDLYPWLSLRAYLLATPTHTPTETPLPTNTLLPETTLDAQGNVLPTKGKWQPADSDAEVLVEFVVPERPTGDIYDQITEIVVSGKIFQRQTCTETAVESVEMEDELIIAAGIVVFFRDPSSDLDVQLNGHFVSSTRAEGQFIFWCEADTITGQWVAVFSGE